MELRELRYFLALAETRHFGHAARRSGIAQPPLSRAIAKLEAEVGVPLLARRRPPVTLTAAGEALLSEARDLIAGADRAVAATRAAGSPGGRVAIGHVSPAGVHIVPALMRAAARELPGIQIDLRRATTAEQIALLLEGSLDVAIVGGPVDDARLEVELLPFEDELVVAVMDRGGPVEADPIALLSLREQPFVLLGNLEVGLGARVVELCRAAGFYPTIADQADDLDAVMSLVSGGHGVSLVPAGEPGVHRPGVRIRRLTEAPGLRFAVAWTPDDEPRTNVAAVVRLLLA